MMTTSEYIEYCEEEVKMVSKSEDDDFEFFQTRNFPEYFEEDLKEEIEDENYPDTKLIRHTCDICIKSYASARSLTNHIQSLHKGRKYPCDLCTYQAMRKDHLIAHIQCLHEKVKYSCNQCEYKATRQSSLKTHIESVHEKVKYSCNQCEYKATYSVSP